MNSPFVLVMVGTDHHPFDRLIEWVDAAAKRRDDVRFVVQYGQSRAPLVAEGHAYLSAEEVARLSRTAVAFVSHAGPGLILDAKVAGHVSICVPRDPALGEHVDNHQLLFSRRVGDLGVVDRVTTEEDFDCALDRVLVTGAAGVPLQRFGAAELALSARAKLGVELDRLMRLKAGSRVRLAAADVSDSPAPPVQLGHHPLRSHQARQDQNGKRRAGLEREIS